MQRPILAQKAPRNLPGKCSHHLKVSLHQLAVGETLQKAGHVYLSLDGSVRVTYAQLGLQEERQQAWQHEELPGGQQLPRGCPCGEQQMGGRRLNNELQLLEAQTKA